MKQGETLGVFRRTEMLVEFKEDFSVTCKSLIGRINISLCNDK